LPKPEVVWINLKRAVDRFVCRIEIAQRLVTESEILQHPTVFRIETGRFLQIGGGFRPFSQAALDRAKREITFSLVGQIALRDFEFFQCRLEIVVAVIKGKSHRQMRLRQVRLQTQRLLRERARFFAALDGAFESMDDPAFQLRIARNGESKHWIELDGPRVKLLALFE